MLELILTFLKIGTFTFGGGMVMVAFMEQDAVNTFGWLTNREFVDAVAMGQITPGPFLITSVFIGFKVAGLPGSVAALVSVLLPAFLLTITAAGQLRRVMGDLRVRAFIRGVGPAVVGMLLAAGLSLARTAVTDAPSLLLSVACLVALIRFKVDAALVVAIAAAIGFLFM